MKFTKAEDRVIREMSIDVDKMYPNRRQKEWFAAQAYLVGKDELIEPDRVSRIGFINWSSLRMQM